jgi:hypothetical protein
MNRLPGLVLVVSMSLLLPACGGAGGGDAPADAALPKERTTALQSVADLDGAIFGSLVSGARPDLVPQVGIHHSAFWYGYVGFDLAGIPAGQIVSATLEVGQTAVVGDPYGKWGPIEVHTVDGGAALDLADAYVANPRGTLSTDATLGVKRLDLTEIVTRARAEGWTSFLCRLRFATYVFQPGDDYAVFNDGADQAGAPGARPALVVRTRD